MNVPDRPFAILPWGDLLLDEGLDNWTGEAFDAVEVYCHVESAGSYRAPATLYTCPNEGRTVEWLIDRARHLGLAVILNGDIFMGTGRPDDDGSPPGPGRYHHTWAEGGYSTMVDGILRWPARLREPVIAFQALNEPPNVAWLANWTRDNVLRRHGARLAGQGWKLIGAAGSEHLRAYADMIDVIDPHGIWNEPDEVAREQRELQRAYPRHEQWWSELIDEHGSHVQESVATVLANGAEAYSGFGGNRRHFSRWITWNFKTRRAWTHWVDEGLTEHGRAWERVRGMRGGGDHPVPVPVPVPTPTPGPGPMPVPDPPHGGITMDDAQTIRRIARATKAKTNRREGKEWRRGENKRVNEDMDELERIADRILGADDGSE